MAHLARIFVYPIKSLDAVEIREAKVQATGALAFDRRFALVDLQGRFMNGKRSPKIQQIRSRFEPDLHGVQLIAPDVSDAPTFRLPNQGGSLAGWIGRFLGTPLVLSENSVIGFPDDPDFPGPTIISTATLRTVADWFNLTLPEARARFRANLEIDGVEPFWEDTLVPDQPGANRVRIGAFEFLAGNVCLRCAVPTRESTTGRATEKFVARFTAEREATLIHGAPRARFDSFYRLAINTRPAANSGEQVIKVGDSIEKHDFVPLD